jgi:hypothetical protein
MIHERCIKIVYENMFAPLTEIIVGTADVRRKENIYKADMGKRPKSKLS